MSADTKTQLKVAAVTVPLGFTVGCIYQMLKQKIGVSEAISIYVELMRESVPLVFVMLFVFYVAGMFTLIALGHFGAKANRLLRTSPDLK